jgi:hypothetical protein
MPEGPYWFDPFWSPSPWPPVNPWVFPRRPPRPPTDPDVKRAVAAIKATKKSRPFSDFLPSSINPPTYSKKDAEWLTSHGYPTSEGATIPEYSSRGLIGSTPSARALAALAALWATNYVPRSGVLPTVDDSDTRGAGSIFTGDPFKPFWRLDELLQRVGVRYKRTNRPGKTRTGPGGSIPTQPTVIEERPAPPFEDAKGRIILPGDWVDREYGEYWPPQAIPTEEEWKKMTKRPYRWYQPSGPAPNETPRGRPQEAGAEEVLGEAGVDIDEEAAEADQFSEKAHKRAVDDAFKLPAKPKLSQQILQGVINHLPDLAKMLARPPKINISQPAQFAATPPELLPTAYLPQRGADTGADFASLAFAQPFPQPSSRRGSRTDECECAPKKKKRKKGCVNPVISRTTREGIRTTKTRIVCQPSKRK